MSQRLDGSRGVQKNDAQKAGDPYWNGWKIQNPSTGRASETFLVDVLLIGTFSGWVHWYLEFFSKSLSKSGEGFTLSTLDAGLV